PRGRDIANRWPAAGAPDAAIPWHQRGRQRAAGMGRGRGRVRWTRACREVGGGAWLGVRCPACRWSKWCEVSGRGVHRARRTSGSGELVATLAVMRRFDLTDGQWAALSPLLPVGKKAGRPPVWTKRQLIDGIRWRVRTGAPWRDVPECYGSWQAAYALFRRWQMSGAWQQVVTALQARAGAARP